MKFIQTVAVVHWSRKILGQIILQKSETTLVPQAAKTAAAATFPEGKFPLRSQIRAGILCSLLRYFKGWSDRLHENNTSDMKNIRMNATRTLHSLQRSCHQ